MKIYRRTFLASIGITAASGMLGGMVACGRESQHSDQPGSENQVPEKDMQSKVDFWEDVRAQFELDDEVIHMAGLLLSSHPKQVRDAIEKYRTELNQNPAIYVSKMFSPMNLQIRQTAADYMGVQPEEIALTDSTTMGTGLAITGLHIREDQEMLTTHFDYHSTHEAMRYQSARSGASIREIPLYQDIHEVTENEMVDTLTSEIRSNTRLVTATWVHSATGLKVPVSRIAERIAEINARRDAADRVVFFVDGVHGFGVEATPVADLGCDFFTAGTHKWMFGPRGTGVLWGHPRAHNDVSPTIPTFTNNAGWGGLMSPGGFKPFEHKWAVVDAFKFHQQIGKTKIQHRIHALARQLKEGLEKMDHITLYTPMQEHLSSGIVCFDVDGMNAKQVVEALHQRNVVASDTPYSPSYARLTPGIYNTSEEMEQTLRAVNELG